MKSRNKKIFSNDQNYLSTIRAEYTLIGYDTSLEIGCLTVLTRRRPKPKPKKEERRPRREDR